MLFKDRQDAGRRLAGSLRRYTGRSDVILLGIPRGGVPVAHEIASALRSPLDLMLVSKLAVPGQEEVAFGALTEGQGCFVDEIAMRHAGVTKEQLAFAQRRAVQKLQGQSLFYRKSGVRPDTQGRSVILVDDGVATGATMYAAIQAIRATKPARIILAIPVAPASTCRWLSRLCDEAIFLSVPSRFYATSDAYQNFSQVTNNEVLACMSHSYAA